MTWANLIYIFSVVLFHTHNNRAPSHGEACMIITNSDDALPYWGSLGKDAYLEAVIFCVENALPLLHFSDGERLGLALCKLHIHLNSRQLPACACQPCKKTSALPLWKVYGPWCYPKLSQWMMHVVQSHYLNMPRLATHYCRAWHAQKICTSHSSMQLNQEAIKNAYAKPLAAGTSQMRIMSTMPLQMLSLCLVCKACCAWGCSRCCCRRSRWSRWSRRKFSRFPLLGLTGWLGATRASGNASPTLPLPLRLGGSRTSRCQSPAKAKVWGRHANKQSTGQCRNMTLFCYIFVHVKSCLFTFIVFNMVVLPCI